MKIKNLLWGIFFILAGGLVIVNQLGYFPGLSLLNLVLIIAAIPIVVTSCIHLNFGGILFSLAILGIVFDKQLGITELTPWPILITALLGTIGLELIFHKVKRKSSFIHINTGSGYDEIIDCPDNELINHSVNFSSAIKYINSDNFKKANFSCHFGALKVYFDNATIKDNKAEINIQCSFGGVELFIPKTWQILNNTNTSLGEIEEKNKNSSNSDGPVVRLNGSISLGAVEITYI